MKTRVEIQSKVRQDLDFLNKVDDRILKRYFPEMCVEQIMESVIDELVNTQESIVECVKRGEKPKEPDMFLKLDDLRYISHKSGGVGAVMMEMLLGNPKINFPHLIIPLEGESENI